MPDDGSGSVAEAERIRLPASELLKYRVFPLRKAFGRLAASSVTVGALGGVVSSIARAVDRDRSAANAITIINAAVLPARRGLRVSPRDARGRANCRPPGSAEAAARIRAQIVPVTETGSAGDVRCRRRLCVNPPLP